MTFCRSLRDWKRGVLGLRGVRVWVEGLRALGSEE